MELAFGVTSEIYLLERVLRVVAVMVTSELRCSCTVARLQYFLLLLSQSRSIAL